MTDEPNTLPLQGYRVADFTQYVAGPSATLLLAEMGAEVIKVEFAPGGDPMRTLPYIRDGRSTQYVQHNRGKKSICLDLKGPEGRKVLKDLARNCDVFIENFTPGVVARMGITYELLKELNPRIIMCSITAFGSEGPLAQEPGFDSCGAAYAGALDLIGNANGAPTPPQMGIGDIATGMHAFSGIVCALLHRERTGRGQHIEVSLLDSWFYFHESAPAHVSVEGSAIEPRRNGGHTIYAAPAGPYKGVEKYFMILAPFDGQFARLCEAFGRADVMEDPRFNSPAARVANIEALMALIEGWMQTVSSDDELAALFSEHRIPAAPILSVREATSHPHMRQRGTARSIRDRVLGEFVVPGLPIRSAELGPPRDMEAPVLGEHNVEVLTEVLGYTAEETRRLQQAGVLHRGTV